LLHEGPVNAVASPRWFPHALDLAADRLLVVEKSEADYREAAFLDDRSLMPGRAQHWVPWDAVAGIVPPEARRDLHYIFHIGHVGSTLVSRLLGELPGVLALREPLVLRTLAENPSAIPRYRDGLTALLSRTFRPEQRSMVKATSFVSEIAGELVPPGSKALLLYARPERYVETILAGENSRREIALTADSRRARLEARGGALPPARSEGETVALCWAAEMTALVQACERLPAEAALFMDFDEFLAAPAEALIRLAAFFRLALDTEGAEGLATHPLMGRYSKATEYEYDSDLRERVLSQCRAEHGGEIAAARSWLDSASAGPTVAKALDIASTGAGAAANR
jgi:hypothetical protein